MTAAWCRPWWESGPALPPCRCRGVMSHRPRCPRGVEIRRREQSRLWAMGGVAR